MKGSSQWNTKYQNKVMSKFTFSLPNDKHLMAALDLKAVFGETLEI